MSDALILNIKGIYFDQIVAGTKPAEFRLRTPYWRKRLEGRTYKRIILKRGYPKNEDAARILIMPWRGYEERTISHPHFGPEPVGVYAINVDRAAP
jgi:hypothetical protein